LNHSVLGGFSVKAKLVLLLTLCTSSLLAAAQISNIIPLASEPHHRIALHNKYVNVYKVEVAPHDSVQLHRHDFDAISIMMSDSQVTVHTPGKPEVQQKLSDGQVRLQRRGYVHSTSIDGDSVYRNVTIELLLPQEQERNLCSPVIASQPLNCPSAQASPIATRIEQPLFETDQSNVTLIRVLPHQEFSLSNAGGPELVVVLDPITITSAGGNSPEDSLRAGDFKWADVGQEAFVYKNASDKEARLIAFRLKPQESAATAPPPTK
jgi:quercetin dioxygenase-like cupin family protein